MRNTTTKISLLLSFLFCFGAPAFANDSDMVNCNHAWKIVVLGSSSSYGYGASTYDSAWVGKFTAYVKRKNPSNEVYNLGIPGFTTYKNLCPTGFTPPADRPESDNSFNITAALALHADAIIINMPTNDAANDFTVAEQQANYERALHLADSANIPVWVTTTQPRNNMSAAQVNNLVTMRDWTYTRFAAKAVDFWTTIANADGSIATYYDYDYAHVNDFGHELFYRRIKAANILDSLCARITQTLVARAGNDINVTLPLSNSLLDGSSSFSSNGGTITSYQWAQVSGNSAVLGAATNAVANVNNLSEGRYAFSLTVTDNLLNVRSDTVNIIVSSRILIDFGPELTASPDANGNYWNSVTETQPGIKLQNSLTVGNVVTGIGFQVVNRIDGTFNVSGPGTNTGNTTGAVNDYPATATNDFSFAEPSATDGRWTITGLEKSRQYSIKFWGTRTVSDNRIIQIKRADQNTWQEYNAANNSNYNNAATFTFSGKASMSFDIRVKSGSAFGYISLIDIARTTPAVAANIAPVATAADLTVSLPATSGLLDGSNSTDDDGNIISYEWLQTSGPSIAQIMSATSAVTSVNNLIEGIYTFRLKVTDDSSAVGTANIRLTVNTRILFDFGPEVITGADGGGKYWNNIITGTEGIKTDHAITTGNIATAVSLEIINRIDGTFNVNGPGTNTGNSVGEVGDYPANATADFAFAHPGATNGQWKLAGLDSTKYYSVKFWGTRSTSDDRIIKIKRFDETNFQQYNAAGNNNYNNAAVFNFTGKTAMFFDISVAENSAFGYISVMDIKITNEPLYCAPAVTIHSTQTAPACAGTAISFTATVTGAGSSSAVYQWQKNGLDISGEQAAVYTSSSLSNNDSIRCKITINTNCAFGITAYSNSVAARLFAVPVTGNIAGPASACGFSGTTTQVTYTVDPVENATGYLWTLPANVSLVSGQGTNSITVIFNNNYTTSVLSVKAVAACLTSNESLLTVTATTTPTPGIISGPTEACAYIGSATLATYTIRKVNAAAAYIWELPAGVILNAHPAGNTENDTIIKVSFNNNFVHGSFLSVKVSGCAAGLASTLAIRRTVPATPEAINIVSYPCKYLNLIPAGSFSIRKVEGAGSYNWTVPAGSIVSHPAGAGVNDTIISVTFPLTFSSGIISVVSVNACGTNNIASSVLVNAVTPATISLNLSGPTNACGYIGNIAAAVYKVNRIPGITSYTWTAPAGATVTHPNGTGLNDTTILVNYPATFNSGIISVKANTDCGSSPAKTLTVEKSPAATPGTITSKQISNCPTIYTYSIAALPANTTSTVWTVPASGNILSGQGSTSITVSYNALVLLSAVSVAGKNDCGTGTASKLTILNLSVCLGNQRSAGTSNTVIKKEMEKEILPAGLEIKLLTNPSYNDFKFNIKSNDRSTPVLLRVSDMSGKLVETRQLSAYSQQISLGGNYKTGMYLCEFMQADKKMIIKIVKL